MTPLGVDSNAKLVFAVTCRSISSEASPQTDEACRARFWSIEKAPVDRSGSACAAPVIGPLTVVTFQKKQRKDDVAAEYRQRFQGTEGVLFLGKAQEKVAVFRTEKRTGRDGKKYPWIVKSATPVNQFYFYCLDADFGPFFLKFSTYFPYNAKLCINGHEYVKRQLAKEGIAFEALDNGILSCACPKRLQEICDSLSAAKIDALLRKWLAKLPHPYTAADRQAGHRYDISILQAEFSLTQVLDRPQTGRLFFEDVIREN